MSAATCRGTFDPIIAADITSRPSGSSTAGGRTGAARNDCRITIASAPRIASAAPPRICHGARPRAYTATPAIAMMKTLNAMRCVLDQIVAHPQGIDPATFAEIQRYTKYFWINNGPYNNLTARKFVLKTTPEAFAAAAKAAQAAGATFTQNEETLDSMLKRLEPMFFDPNFDASVTTKAPPPGKDILTGSANNLYAGGVTMNDVKGFNEKYGLNARLVKANGTLTEEVYKIDG